MIVTDVLVIGSGIAGLTYALKMANRFPEKKITVITKSNESESNSKYAQGGIAVAINQLSDSFDKHIEDTLLAGDGLCNKKVVEFVVKEGYERINEFIKWGVNFDKTHSGEYDLGREGGHTVNRIMHHKDCTGLEMEQILLKQVHAISNIQILQHYFAIDLITQHHLIHKEPNERIKCYGAYVLNLKTNQIEKALSEITLLATGGSGQVYLNTTNPTIATADGLSMAFRAGAEVQNMEFIQFHPTALFHPEESPSFLISEAVRGFGAILRNKSGEEFMHNYDKRKELASRDIVARAIDHEMKVRGEDYVYLDCRHIHTKSFIQHFPNIYKKCKSIGIIISKDMIPVVPAAHYQCGGIAVNEMGETNIENLLACGECASTGLHGANRLASNSLLEALVFAHRCFTFSIPKLEKASFSKNIPDWNAEGTSHPKEKIIITHTKKALQQLMSDYVGIVRSNERLEKAMKSIRLLKEEVSALYAKSTLSMELCELRNLLDAAYLITNQSINRKENKGVFYNLDLH